MKNLILPILFCLALFNGLAQNNYPPYEESFSTDVFIPAGYTGGGTATVRVEYNTVTIIGSIGINGGQQSSLNTGQVVQLNAPYALPNVTLGYITDTAGGGGLSSYQVSIVDNWIVLTSQTNETVSYVNFNNLSADLTPNDPDDNTPSTSAPDRGENYVHVLESTLPVDGSLYSAYDSSTNTYTLRQGVRQSVMYVDGLGRDMQSIAIQQTPNGKDIIKQFEYDALGRMDRDYLAYPSSQQGSGAFVAPAQALAEQSQYYQVNFPEDLTGTINPFTEKVFEDSPLGRIEEIGAPGSDWAAQDGTDTDHTIKFEHGFNTHGTGGDNVKRFGVSFPSGDEETELEFIDYYNPNELYRIITRDENWQPGQTFERDHTVVEFKDRQGRVILKRAFNENQPHDTQYVYDEYGNLTYVIPPLASDQIVDFGPQGFRVASQVNYPWVNLVEVNSAFAEEYNRKLEEYENVDILNADIENEYGGQGGYTVTTLEDSELVTLSISFSAAQPLVLKQGEIASLKEFGSFKDTEMGRISGNGFEYIFTIKNNAIVVIKEGKEKGDLLGVNQTFSSNTVLSYSMNYPWSSYTDVDPKFAADYEKQLEAYSNSDILTVYIENQYGGQGGLNISIDENDIVSVNINSSSTIPLKLKKGLVVPLDTERALEDRELGEVSGAGYSYRFFIKEKSLYIEGDGEVSGLSAFLTAPTSPPSPTIDNTTVEGLCYIYHYDYRNRLIEKKIPGKGWEYIVYDRLNRPILTQDAKMRLDNQWLFTKYDILDRVLYTGKYTYVPNGTGDDSGRSEQQLGINDSPDGTNWNEIKQATNSNLGIIYSNDVYPNTVSDMELLIINFYDDYQGIDEPDIELPLNSTVFDEPISMGTKSLPTGDKIKILATDFWITTVTYYDDRGRPIYIGSKNEYLNTIDIARNDLDFVGKVLRSESSHTRGTDPTIITEDSFTYDQTGRLQTQTQSINGQAEELIANNHYNELGQLVDKNVGGTVATVPTASSGLQAVDYAYNIRGWLKTVNEGLTSNGDLFGFSINYNTPTTGADALFNGNISETHWQSANDHNPRSYGYGYDALNRITSADYHGNYTVKGLTDIENYSLNNVSYDRNGNILTLSRSGLRAMDGGNPIGIDVIDDLTYSYEPLSNKLTSVHDDGFEDGFDDKNLGNDDYAYDINGNMVLDRNKEIVSIEYNHLNLPTSISYYDDSEFVTQGVIEYVYDSNGTKLSKNVTASGPTIRIPPKLTLYNGVFIYGGNSDEFAELKYISQPEGYVEPDGNGSFDYVYQYKDHLGNVRLSYSDVNGNGSVDKFEIMDEKNYYPFGGTHTGYNTQVLGTYHPYGYNDKEENEEFGLALLDFGVRNFDPVLGRWMSIDPLAEKFTPVSPYVFGANSPLRFTDPDGKDIINVTGGVKFTGNDAQIAFRTLKNSIRSNSNNTPNIHFVYEDVTPNIYRHTLNSFQKGKPEVLHYDPDKKRQRARRRLSTWKYPSRYYEGLQRDEYPYASTFEGGLGAEVAYVPSKENASQGGSLRALYANMKLGDEFLVLPVPSEREPEAEPVPVEDPVYTPDNIPDPIIPVVPIPSTNPKPAPGIINRVLQGLLNRIPLFIISTPLMEQQIYPYGRDFSTLEI